MSFAETARASLRFLVPAVVLAVAPPGEVFAQDERPVFFGETQIEGASKHAEAPEESPATVTVVSRDDIERYGFRTLAEVINFASAGMFVNGDRRVDFLGARGVFLWEDYNTRVLLMLNGHPMNEPWNQFAGMGREMLVPLELVERIEVVYGPSALLYGGYGIYGMINVVTRNGSSMPGTIASMTAGNWDTVEVGLTWGGSGSLPATVEDGPGTEWDVLAGAGMYRTSGESLDLPRIGESYGGPQEHGSDFERAPWAFLLARRGDFSILGRAGYRKRGQPLSPYGMTYGTNDSSIRDEKNLIELRWDPSPSPQTDLSMRVFSDWYRYDEQDLYDDDPVSHPDGRFFGLEAADTDYGGELRVNTRVGTHLITAGVESRWRRIDQRIFSQSRDEQIIEGSLLRQQSNGRLTVAYVQEEWRPSRAWTFVAGAAWADSEPGSTKLLPRLAVIHKPSPTLAIKALHARGFRPPSVYESDYADYEPQLPNPALQSESIASTEVALIWRASAQATVEAFVFRGKLDNLISDEFIADPDQVQGGVLPPSGNPADLVGLLQYQAVGEVSSNGAGSTLRLRGARFRGYLNAFLAEARDERLDAGRLPGAQRWSGSGGLSVDLGRWTASMTARYVGPIALDPAFKSTEKAGNFAEANLSVLWRTRFHYPADVRLDIKNLFDEEGPLPSSPVHTPATYPIEGRRVYLGVGFQL